ncbi:MAG: GNAT family N-acetyltransferase [Malacoplasma sp.]|nr:GNAT family N-acetyltransferase [Malacoplasma sp.]
MSNNQHLIILRNKQNILEAEIKQIAELEKQLFFNNCYETQDLLKLFNEANLNCLCLYENQILIAYCLFTNEIEMIDVYKIGVVKSFQQKGFGNLLIKELKSFNKTILIEVSDRDATQNFYLKNGFLKLGVRKNYYWDKSNAIVFKWDPQIF